MRIISFDILKCVAIILACSLHYPLFLKGSIIAEIWQLLCMGAVPVFFAVNGALLFSKPFNLDKHLARIKKLFISVIICKLIILAILQIFGQFAFSDFSISDWITYLFSSAKVGNIPTEHLWFIYALISAYIVFPFLKKAFDSKEGARYLELLLSFLFIAYFVVTDLSWLSIALASAFDGFPILDFNEIASSFSPFYSLGWCLFFFISGALFRKYLSNVQTNHFKVGIMLVIIGIMLGLAQDRVYFGMWGWSGSVILLQYQHIATILVAFGMMSLSHGIKRLPAVAERLVTACSKNTLVIYYFHMPVLYLFLIYLQGYFPVGWLANTIRVVIVVFGLALLGWAMKHIPILRQLF